MSGFKIVQEQLNKTFLQPDLWSGSFAWTGVDDDARRLFLAAHLEKASEPVIILSASEKEGKRLHQFLTAGGFDQVVYFPPDEVIPFDVYAQSEELTRQRAAVLAQVTEAKPSVVITTVAALGSCLLPAEKWIKGKRDLHIGDVINVPEFIDHLITIGYRHQSIVDQPGDLSWRGGIIDIFSPSSELPLRIELFDDEIDSLRYFDVSTQRSFEPQSAALITPANEFFYTEEGEEWAESLQLLRKKIKTEGQNKYSKEVKQIIDERLNQMVQTLKLNEPNPNIKRYRGIFYPQKISLLDYYYNKPIIFLEDQYRIENEIDEIIEERKNHFADLLSEGLALAEQWDNYFDKNDYKNMFKNNRILSFTLLFREDSVVPTVHQASAEIESLPPIIHQDMTLTDSLRRWLDEGFKVICPISDEMAAKRFKEHLFEFNVPVSDNGHQKNTVQIISDALPGGGIFWRDQLIILPIEKTLAKSKKQRKLISQRKDGIAYETIDSIMPSDYVVHDHYGIGIYLGLEHIKAGEVEGDYLLIKYSGSDKLYVPVEQFDLLKKYVGQEGRKPRLNKLSNTEWERTKKRISQSVADLADELIRLYAKRESEPGFAFSPDDDLQREFEATFPYVETDDQLKAISDVKKDMMRPVPMDRLICGDVGYGKTEVAIRASFKAVSDGKQVAILVPTTVLAQQHYETFSSRLEGFGARVAVLSRFTTAKETSQIYQMIKDHQVDVIIGTHRLLNKKIEFSDLGLLVVDEEQRFGVTHKERIKSIKTEVDVLTLSATPIPRTLHLSLAGIRDMSLIETPPADRYPIQTYVVEETPKILTQAIRRELDRKGQIFVVENRIDNLDKIAATIQEVVPEARILLAHGRMGEKSLEQAMLEFSNHQADVLVSTTIIESGLDIANVNTLFVYHADNMGLSQLYQLRGRVGRRNRIAYAYLTYDRHKRLTPLAEKRLNTLREFTALGSGYRIAMKDLELRGAGRLLGAEQHGHAVDVGFDMYMTLLSEAIAERTDKEKTIKKKSVELDLRTSAFIPETYVSDDNLRLSLYKRLDKTTSEEELSDLLDEIIDRFGNPPESLLILISLIKIRFTAQEIGIRLVKQKRKQIEMYFYSNSTIDIVQVMKFVNKHSPGVSISNKSGELTLVFALDEELLSQDSLDSIKMRLDALLLIVNAE